MLQDLWKYLGASAWVPLAPTRHRVRDSLSICRKRALARAGRWAPLQGTLSRELSAGWILGRNDLPSFNKQVTRKKEGKHGKLEIGPKEDNASPPNRKSNALLPTGMQ